jgi:hypothetical protein
LIVFVKVVIQLFKNCLLKAAASLLASAHSMHTTPHPNTTELLHQLHQQLNHPVLMSMTAALRSGSAQAMPSSELPCAQHLLLQGIGTVAPLVGTVLWQRCLPHVNWLYNEYTTHTYSTEA